MKRKLRMRLILGGLGPLSEAFFLISESIFTSGGAIIHAQKSVIERFLPFYDITCN
jgi:hypothetical protein